LDALRHERVTFADCEARFKPICCAAMKSRRALSMMLLLPALVLSWMTGCSANLETGYKPNRLGATDATRRSYYASPFTPEARAAQLEREQELQQRRPHPGE
jgi:hypothetical protein